MGETQALIAGRLVAEEPGLVVPGRRAELMEKISSIYDRDHAVYVTLSDADIALACLRLKNASRSERNSPRYALAAQVALALPSLLVLVPRARYPSTTWRLLRTARDQHDW